MAEAKVHLDPSRIIGIQFSILSADEIRRSSVANITSRDTYVNNKPVIGGLFDPRMGVLDPGLVCPTDGLNYMQTPGYFGHIEMARPVFYIQYLNTVLKILRCVCIKCSNILISKRKHEHILEFTSRGRWMYVFPKASKISRCGDDTCEGCGTKQPRKIYKEGLATIIAEWDEIEGIVEEEGAAPTSAKLVMKLTPEIVLKIFRRVSDDDVNFMGFSSVFSRPEWMICQVLAVPPPAMRPSVKHDAQQRSEDDISHIIVNIIKANKTLQDKIERDASAKVIEDWTTVLQYYVATMIDNRIPGVASVAQRSGRALKSIKERLVGKSGRVRGNLMGKRVDYSARSVITPDPNIGISQLGVPIKIAKNITYPERVNAHNKDYLFRLVLNGPETYPGAKILEKSSGNAISLRYVDRKSLELREGDVVHRHMLDGDPVLFNRQPTLHRMSMMCHYAKILKKGDTFRLNVADTKPYNADFDGDEMNLHGPQDEESCSELINLAAVARQIISPANNKSIIGIFQDSLLGAFRFTRTNTQFTPKQAMNLLMGVDDISPNLFRYPSKSITNFAILSQIIPPMTAKFPNGQFVEEGDRETSNDIIDIVGGTYKRGQLDKGALGSTSKGLIQSIFNDFGHLASAKFIDNLQNIVTSYMTVSAYSVGISDLIADNATNLEIADAIVQKKTEVKNLIDQTHIGVFENNTGKTNEIEFETQVNAILNKAQEQAGKIGRRSLARDNRFVLMVNAGSKGSSLNIAQMVSCLGQQNVDGKRIPYGFENRTLPHYPKFDDSPEARGFVESSFIDGLTPTELYFHAMGGRTGLIDTAVKTSTTGYIQRRLVKGLEDIHVCYDGTVRNSKNKIIQFRYGDDGIDPTRVENQILPLGRMTLEEIYSHFQISTSLDGPTSYTKAARSRLARQAEALIQITQNRIENMVNARTKVIQNVFNERDGVVVHMAVNFKRIIANVQHQLKIRRTSAVNITPLEAYQLIDKSFAGLMKIKYAPPTELFKILYQFYLSPTNLLTVRHFNRRGLVALLALLSANYKKAIANPGEMVGVIAAQSIGEPTTQMTLNTFHFAGVASKSNVTRGVPRIEEILSLSENPKNPSITVYLKDEERESLARAQQLRYSLEYTSLRAVTRYVGIYFDPDDTDTLIQGDKVLVEEYLAFTKMVEGCADIAPLDKPMAPKWVIRFVLDKEAMLEKDISMDDIHFAIQYGYKTEASCIYSDYNADNLIFRVRLSKSLTSSKKKSIDQSDEIYMLKNLQENMLDHIILRGIKHIPKVVLRKSVDQLMLKDGNYIKEDTWVLDTIGTNLRGVLSLTEIDNRKTYTNDIQEVFRVLGIEATRQSIFNELQEALDFAGTYINYHHLSLLCDRMTATRRLVSMFRHGINNDDIGPLAKASFEETPEMFLRAARHAELDIMTGVSANVMVGQTGYFGTGCFQVILDGAELDQLGAKQVAVEKSIEELLRVEDPRAPCSQQTIAISDTAEHLDGKDTGTVDKDYDMGF